MNKITEIQILPIKPNNGLIAFASVVLNEELYLGSIGVHRKIDGSGYRLTYPTKKVGEKNLNIYHPISSSLGIMIEKLIFKKIEELF
ncbi:MAG: hypothetical protein A2271_02405 [Candidatus Moranbacteria bacterium RIFOXYA12_FULL_35_19]|nr:MAG: hypothetical protein UR78_C0008G0029 [Candidatus Moranbacteria bacterium GW2011_GWF2_35_39]OGI30251.1 MAG: hypothetical protein A2343_00105 [Candidatus Moranbacteria bacterium RIFOXYB12_FULL_35_8]OGI35391.1 MAG: hypothetical protein A2271_02405 [Candidatus Moranbacteria bacterium RIFOXYA12_FULL_35_19]